MPSHGTWGSDLTFSSGYIAAVLIALVLLSMLAAYMCLLREEMRSDFEESRAWRLRWQEEADDFPLAPFHLELHGPIPLDLGRTLGQHGQGHVRYCLEVMNDGQVIGQAWRPHSCDILEVNIMGKLRMITPAYGEVRWRERSGWSSSEVHGCVFLEASDVQIDATYYQHDAKSGQFQLRGTLQPERQRSPSNASYSFTVDSTNEDEATNLPVKTALSL